MKIEEKIREKAEQDFGFFLFNFVFTRDWNDAKNPVKKFPKEPCYQDLIELTMKYPWTIMAKSRQIMATWFFCAELVWRILNTGNIFAVVKSTKKDKSAWGTSTKDETFALERGDKQSLLSRIHHIIMNLPPFFQLHASATSHPPGIAIIDKYQNRESHIKAGTQDPGELAGYTINHLIIDEAARQKDAGEAYTTIVPAMSEDSVVRVFSTAKGKEWFYKTFYELDAIFNQGNKISVDHKKLNVPDTLLAPLPIDREIKTTPSGIIFWESGSPLNPFVKIIFHYSATPKGKNPEWVKRQRARCLSQKAWDREYEISFDVFTDDEPVYPMFVPNKHIGNVEYNPKLPVYRGWDFGNTSACVWCQIDGCNVAVLREHIVFNNAFTQTFAEQVIEISQREFPNAKFIDFVDPKSGIDRSARVRETNVDILRALGIKPHWDNKRVSWRVSLITILLERTYNNKPGIIINPKCENLITGFVSGYVRDAQTGDPKEDKIYEHTQDALGYIIVGKFRNIRKLITEGQVDKTKTEKKPMPFWGLLPSKPSVTRYI